MHEINVVPWLMLAGELLIFSLYYAQLKCQITAKSKYASYFVKFIIKTSRLYFFCFKCIIV